MHVEVDYGGRIYGTGTYPKKYKLTVSSTDLTRERELAKAFGRPLPSSQNVYCELRFDPAAAGRSEKMYGDQSAVDGFRFTMPKPQAVRLAQEILKAAEKPGHSATSELAESSG